MLPLLFKNGDDNDVIESLGHVFSLPDSIKDGVKSFKDHWSRCFKNVCRDSIHSWSFAWACLRVMAFLASCRVGGRLRLSIISL